jgi:hypothetical protein
LTLERVFGANTAAIDKITSAGQIVFHATGDCGHARPTNAKRSHRQNGDRFPRNRNERGTPV